MAEPPPRAVADAGPVGAVAPPVSTAPRWGKVPDASGEVSVAIEGHCSHLGVSPLANATLVHYGNVIAQASGDALAPVPTKLEAGDVANIHEIVGHWPDSAWLAYDNDGRCSYNSRALRFVESASAWKPAFSVGESLSVTDVQPYMNGAIGLLACSGCGGETDCKRRSFVGAGLKQPPLTGDGFVVADYATLPTGEVFAIGAVCKDPTSCTGQLRWWTPGGKVGWDVTGSTSDPSYDSSHGRSAHLIVRSKTDVIVSQGAYLGSFDGKGLKKISGPAKSWGELFDAGADGFWAIASDGPNTAEKWLHRKPDGAFEDVTPPKPNRSRDSYDGDFSPAGIAQGTPWTIRGDDVYKREGGAWRKVELPKPSFAFSSKSYFTPSKIRVAAADDVWIVASYFEKQANWDFREVRTALLRTKRMKETYRCSTSDDKSKPSGFASWPSAANDSCKKPFLLLAPVSATSPKSFDYPQTRAVLRPKVDLVQGGVLSEIRENNSVWIGLVPRSVEDGRAIADLYAKHFPLSRSELLCVEANVTRTIPIDAQKKD